MYNHKEMIRQLDELKEDVELLEKEILSLTKDGSKFYNKNIKQAGVRLRGRLQLLIKEMKRMRTDILLLYKQPREKKNGD